MAGIDFDNPDHAAFPITLQGGTGAGPAAGAAAAPPQPAQPT